MKKIILDDGFQEYLVENTNLVGEPGIPEIIDFHNTEVPVDIVPFEKINKETNKRQEYGKDEFRRRGRERSHPR